MTEVESGKWVFIVNPVAGNGFAMTILPKIREMISKHGIDAEVVLTERYGHAVELSALYLEKGYRFFIAVGGDGTMNEVARPLVNRPDLVTGIIPAGTGNDFIQILGFPGRFGESDWDTFFRCNVTGLDAGSVNGKIFLNGMGLGFDAEVAAQNYTEPGKVKTGGSHKYIWHIVKTLLFFREKKMITTDSEGSHTTDCFINTISIGRRFAGGFRLTPKAIADDGLLDVCMIKKLSLAERFPMLLKVPEGKHITDRRVRYYQTPGLSLEFPDDVPFHVDGELNFARSFRVNIMPLALNCIYNPDGNHFFGKV